MSISRLMQMGAAGVPTVQKQAVVFVGSSSIAAYEWIPGTGFGSAYSVPSIPGSYDCFFSNNKDAFLLLGQAILMFLLGRGIPILDLVQPFLNHHHRKPFMLMVGVILIVQTVLL